MSETSIYASVKIYDPKKKFHLEFDRNRYLEEQARDKEVVHVGCSDWPITEPRLEEGTLLHLRLQSVAKELIGIDLSEWGISALKKRGVSNVQVMDAEAIDLPSSYDLILAGDVLEHMNNPGKFLQRAAALLKPGGEIIVGVPSALTINNIKVWFGRWEQVHSDHTFYFSPKTLSGLLKRFDFLPTKLVFTVQPPGDHESRAFLRIRQVLLTLCKAMSPSIIMHFKRAREVDETQYIEWK